MTTQFQIVRSGDAELLDALKSMAADGAGDVACQNFTFAYLSGGSCEVAPGDLDTNGELNAAATKHGRVFQNVRITTPVGDVVIQRHNEGQRSHDNTRPFDIVSVTPNNQQQPHPSSVAQLIAHAQQHLGRFSVNALSSYLGEDAQRHFEARDVALARLEQLVASLTHDLEEARVASEQSLTEKEKHLEDRFDAREVRLEKEYRHRDEELNQKAATLDAREESLNLQAAKAERRQVRHDLKKTLKDWSENFEITSGTTRLRIIIHGLSSVLLALFGIAAGTYLYQSLQALDTAQLIATHIKQGVFTLLFVTTAIFYARWNTHWFEKRAAEEFRLKRMELDFDRASWFVELAFQWKDEYGDEPLPSEIVDRMTAHLFVSSEEEHPAFHPYEALGSALLGASTKVKVGPRGTEVELDRKGIRRLGKDAE